MTGASGLPHGRNIGNVGLDRARQNAGAHPSLFFASESN
jgi:hypothetical protein